MESLQREAELRFSKKGVKRTIRESIDPEEEVIQSIIEVLIDYRTDPEHLLEEGKLDRISLLKEDNLEIALDLACTILPIERNIVPIQMVISDLLRSTNFSDITEGVLTYAEILLRCEGTLYNLLHPEEAENRTGSIGLKPLYGVTKKVREFIDGTFNVLPPMLIEPRDWVKNRGGAWITENKSLISGSVYQYHEEPLAYDVINTLQSVPWELNETILNGFNDKPKKDLIVRQEKENFQQFQHETEEVCNFLLKNGNKFYMPWNYDQRGRSYSTGYHINPQGNSFRKAIMQFKNKELITDEVLI